LKPVYTFFTNFTNRIWLHTERGGTGRVQGAQTRYRQQGELRLAYTEYGTSFITAHTHGGFPCENIPSNKEEFFVKKLKNVVALALAVVVTVSALLIQVSATSDINNLETYGLNAELVFNSDVQGYTHVVDFTSSMGRAVHDGETLASQRLQEAGFSQNFVNGFSDESIEIINSAQRAYILVSYFMEENRYDSDEYELVVISRDEFIRQSAYEYERQMPILVDEYGNYIPSIDPFDVRADRSGGTVVLLTGVFHSPTAQHPGRYIAVTEFGWERMPTSRRTDFLGLARGNGYAVLGNNFSAWFGYYTQRYSFWVQAGLVRSGPFEDPVFGWAAITRNELTPAEGAAIRVNVPTDTLPNFIGSNQTLLGTYRFGLQGGVSYTGTLTHIQPGVFNFNHYSVYLHQSSMGLGTPSISLSLSGPSISFSASPTGSYATPVNNVLTSTWRIN